MNKNIDKYYKTNDFIYFDDKDRFKNLVTSEYGYNFDSTKRSINKLNSIVDKTRIINNEYYNNNKR